MARSAEGVEGFRCLHGSLYERRRRARACRAWLALIACCLPAARSAQTICQGPTAQQRCGRAGRDQKPFARCTWEAHWGKFKSFGFSSPCFATDGS
jgi:hypothetical protein